MTEPGGTEPGAITGDFVAPEASLGGAEVPFHRLARTATYRWWRPLVELVLAILLSYLLGATVVGVLSLFVAGSVLDKEGMWQLAGMGLGIAAALPCTRLAADMAGAREKSSLSSVVGRLRWRWLRTCAFVGLGSVALEFTLHGLCGGAEETGLDAESIAWPGTLTFLARAFVVLAIFPFQAAAEEFLFRGTLLQALGALLPSRWAAIAISGCLFGLAHGTYPPILTFATVYGLVLAWLAIQTGGLEAGIALHAVGNITRFLVLLGTGYDGAWMKDMNSEASWGGVAINGLVQVVTALVIVRLARRAPALRTVSAVT